MAFNDLYFFDLAKGVQSLAIYKDKWCSILIYESIHKGKIGHFMTSYSITLLELNEVDRTDRQVDKKINRLHQKKYSRQSSCFSCNSHRSQKNYYFEKK